MAARAQCQFTLFNPKQQVNGDVVLMMPVKIVISFRILRSVVDLMLIIGGAEDKYLNPSARHLDYEIVTPKGQKCQTTFPTLPDMPANLKNFGLASRKDRYVYLCGGNYLQYTGRKF